MESSEEAVVSEAAGRRTRSGRCTGKTRPNKAPTAKTTGRKTRKKMVLVEVEVSDEEETEHTSTKVEGKSELVDEISDETTNNETINDDGKSESVLDEPTENTDVEALKPETNISEVEKDTTKHEGSIIRTKTELPQQKEMETNNYGDETELLNIGDINVKANEGHSNNKGNESSSYEHDTSDNSDVIIVINNIFDNVTNDDVSTVPSEKENTCQVQNGHTDSNIEPVAAGNLSLNTTLSEPMDVDEEPTFDLKETDSKISLSENKEDEKSNDIEMQDNSKIEIAADAKSSEEKKNESGDPDAENISDEELPIVQAAKVPEAEEVSDEELPGLKRAELNADPVAENISEDELPSVQVAKVPETEEVSDEELPGPKRAELPADTEVVSEDELPAVKKEGTKRKIAEGDYDPGSPTSENEVTPKKPFLDSEAEKEKEKAEKPKKLPELDKYWKAVNDDPTDFTGWTYLLQYVDQENDMEAAREAYDAFLSHYPYCYGYWRKYADYEKRKGNKKKCEEVFERGLKAIPLSVDLWIHYLTYVRTTKPDDEEFVRSQFERALSACGLEFRSDRLWDSYIKWETDGKRLQHVTAIYDRLLTTPTQGYTTHFDNFQEHVTSNPPHKILEVDEFLALRKEVKHMLKHDVTSEVADNPDVPPGEDTEEVSSDEETKAIRERIVSIRRKIHKNTISAVTARWNFEEGIKRPYFHVKPLERCQLKNWQEYLDYEIQQGDQTRIIVLFERCLIACALYEEFWLRFVHYLEGLKDQTLHSKIKDVYERACTIHHLKKPSLHLQWAMFEESVKNYSKASEILVNLEKSVPSILQVAHRRINLERRREDYEKCSQLYEHYITNSKSKVVSSNLAIKYSRFSLKILKNMDKAFEVLNAAVAKDPNNSRLYLQLIDLTLQKDGVCENEVIGYLDSFLEKDNIDIDQKILFAQRKLEFLEDFGTEIQCVQKAYDEYQKYIKTSKDGKKKELAKGETTVGKKEKNPPLPSSQANSYGSYANYGNSSGAASAYQYSGSQQGQFNYSQYGQNDQYQYGNWQYPQGSYGGYNQWSGYGGYGY